MPLQRNLGAYDSKQGKPDGIGDQEKTWGQGTVADSKKCDEAGAECNDQIGLINHQKNISVEQKVTNCATT